MEKIRQIKMISQLNTDELSSISGGYQLPAWVGAAAKKFTAGALAYWIIQSWPDVKSGLVDGWNADNWQ